jgi:hypothetical protein
MYYGALIFEPFSMHRHAVAYHQTSCKINFLFTHLPVTKYSNKHYDAENIILTLIHTWHMGSGLCTTDIQLVAIDI